MVSFSTYGEMSERFKEPVLKTGDGATHRGFESHSLRQKKFHPRWGGTFLMMGWDLKGRSDRRAGIFIVGERFCSNLIIDIFHVFAILSTEIN